MHLSLLLSKKLKHEFLKKVKNMYTKTLKISEKKRSRILFEIVKSIYYVNNMFLIYREIPRRCNHASG